MCKVGYASGGNLRSSFNMIILQFRCIEFKRLLSQKLALMHSICILFLPLRDGPLGKCFFLGGGGGASGVGLFQLAGFFFSCPQPMQDLFLGSSPCHQFSFLLFFFPFMLVSCEITPYICGGFQNTVCACFNANKSSRMAVYSMLFFTFKPWLLRVFLQGCLATSVHDEVATHKMYHP